MTPPPPPPLATGPKRVLFAAAGLICVGLAYLGAILPVMPTTPWVLLASYCFARSSPRLAGWLRRSPLFGRLLRDWEAHRGIRRGVKVFVVGLIICVVSLSVMSGRLPPWLNWVAGGLALCGISTILLIVPTIRDAP